MDSLYRGILEQYYDEITNTKNIKKTYNHWMELKELGIVNSTTDATMASIHDNAFNFFSRLFQGNIEEEIKEFIESFMRRVPEIKSRIKTIDNM